MSRGPATVRIPTLAAEARESERLLKPTTPTLKMAISRETIDAMIEAAEERESQSATLRAAVKAAEDGPTYDTCDSCGASNYTVEERVADDPVGMLCERCDDNRSFGVPSAWDMAWDSGKADR